MNNLSGTEASARWYDPRQGTWTFIGQFNTTGDHEFVPPSAADEADWVLVVEDIEKDDTK
jgi:hypothetical protein